MAGLAARPPLIGDPLCRLTIIAEKGV